MKPLHWDAINPITGQPFTWDDPNLIWKDDGSIYRVDDMQVGLWSATVSLTVGG